MTKMIMSVDEGHLTELELKNRRRDMEYALEHLGLKYEVCEGSWMGVREQAYMINFRTEENFERLKQSAKNCGQVSVLRISSYGGVIESFTNPDFDDEMLGKWTEVDSTGGLMSYTQSFLTGKIYTTI